MREQNKNYSITRSLWSPDGSKKNIPTTRDLICNFLRFCFHLATCEWFRGLNTRDHICFHLALRVLPQRPVIDRPTYANRLSDHKPKRSTWLTHDWHVLFHLTLLQIIRRGGRSRLKHHSRAFLCVTVDAADKRFLWIQTRSHNWWN